MESPSSGEKRLSYARPGAENKDERERKSQGAQIIAGNAANIAQSASNAALREDLNAAITNAKKQEDGLRVLERLTLAYVSQLTEKIKSVEHERDMYLSLMKATEMYKEFRPYPSSTVEEPEWLLNLRNRVSRADNAALFGKGRVLGMEEEK